MTKSKLKVVFITMQITQVLHSLVDAPSFDLVGVVESKKRNPIKQNVYLQKFCLEKNLPYYLMNTGCDVNFENWITNLEPDLVVVFGMSELLKKNIIDIPKKGCINLHPSLLPKYRGAYPFFWTFYHFDLNPGVTVHYIDAGEDTGNIIYQECINLPTGATEEELMMEIINKKGIELLLKAILDIEKGCAPSIKQPLDSTTVRARQILPHEYKKIIDWETWEIVKIWHLLRGTQNWLDVFDFSGVEGNVKGWKILDFSIEEIKLDGGKVYKEDSQYFVACRQGKIYMELAFEQNEDGQKEPFLMLLNK